MEAKECRDRDGASPTVSPSACWRLALIWCIDRRAAKAKSGQSGPTAGGPFLPGPQTLEPNGEQAVTGSCLGQPSTFRRPHLLKTPTQHSKSHRLPHPPAAEPRSRPPLCRRVWSSISEAQGCLRLPPQLAFPTLPPASVRLRLQPIPIVHTFSE